MFDDGGIAWVKVPKIAVPATARVGAATATRHITAASKRRAAACLPRLRRQQAPLCSMARSMLFPPCTSRGSASALARHENTTDDGLDVDKHYKDHRVRSQ